ncbi:MAG: nucleotidyltransferase family protein [Acetobacteraceae bacterium]|nr:nucleotidyltransferase family protein [Acetobacteraceae bacterium]
MKYASRLRAIISEDAARWRLLLLVRSLCLPDCWVGASFVRNAIWSHLHGRTAPLLSSDVDVVWFYADRRDALQDMKIEAALRGLESSIAWSVKNQARMHGRSDDAAYVSVRHAMEFWPETATAVAVRRNEQDDCEIAAPFGLGDLFGLVVRPTPRFAGAKRRVFEERVRAKRWLEVWPLLRVEGSCDCGHQKAFRPLVRRWPAQGRP